MASTPAILPSNSTPKRTWVPTIPSHRANKREASLLMGTAAGQHKLDYQVPNRSLYENDRIFRDFLHPKYDEGWKLHVVTPTPKDLDNSMLPRSGISAANLKEVTSMSKDFKWMIGWLQFKQIPHKFVSNIFGMKRMNETDGQCGKFLTIYPDNEDQMFEIVATVEAFYWNVVVESGDLPPADKPVGHAVTARYGGLTGPCVLKPQNFSNQQKDGPTGSDCYTLDDRTKYKPDHIRDPFDNTSKGFDGWCDYPVAVQVSNSGQPRVRNLPPSDKTYDPATMRFAD